MLKQAGTPVPELCREHDISSATFYTWRSTYGGMDASMMSRMKDWWKEPAFEEDVRRSPDECRHHQGSDDKKGVSPSQRREMAKWAIETKGARIRQTHTDFTISQTCYRSQPKLSDENELIAD